MKQRQFTSEQIVAILQEAENGLLAPLFQLLEKPTQIWIGPS